MAYTTVRIEGRHRYSRPWLYAIAEGFKRHGISILDGRGACDLYVIWSHNETEIIRQQQSSGADYLVAELGYIDRGNYASLGFNGLNGRAEFYNRDVPNDRAEKWLHLLKPEHGGDYTLIIGQCPGDASLSGIDIESWAETVARETDGEAYYRPHPLAYTYIRSAPILNGSLDYDLSRAKKVITYNSNAGVDALMAGCDVVAHDSGSMIYNVTDRLDWIRKLAYCQWSLNEIAAGDAWAHLKQRYA